VHRDWVQRFAQRKRNPLIKKDSHAATGSSKLAVANSSTAST
jgi:hypothetical protein